MFNKNLKQKIDFLEDRIKYLENQLRIVNQIIHLEYGEEYEHEGFYFTNKFKDTLPINLIVQAIMENFGFEIDFTKQVESKVIIRRNIGH